MASKISWGMKFKAATQAVIANNFVGLISFVNKVNVNGPMELSSMIRLLYKIDTLL